MSAREPTLGSTLVSVWHQSLVEGRPTVEVADHRYSVAPSPRQGFRTVEFEFAGAQVTGIEQNPEKTSRWAQLAREGKRIMQFSARGRYIANVCEGKLTRYPSWKALGLPE